MKSITTALIAFLFSINCAAQGDATFKVQKTTTTKKEYQKIFKFNLFPGIDTLDVNQHYMGDITPIMGLYDSVAAFNMQLRIKDNKASLITSKYAGIGMLKFFRKDEKGVFTLIYIRNFTIAPMSRNSYYGEIKMPVK
ncbi:MAG: hypothetical protein JWO06_581 [Bacteroidota bacterium]|nr:hypothetical protein [Bacteroidota bacterium]